MMTTIERAAVGAAVSREHGILFSAPMVRAILDGSKTQTRRAVKDPRVEKIGPANSDTPADFGYYAEGRRFSGWMVLERGVMSRGATNNDHASIPCPYGEPGDRLWVRETWAPHPDEDGAVYRATDPGWDDNGTGLKWHPSIHMPRWASRITLEITEVRVQRLHDISEADIRAEGVTAEAVRDLTGWDCAPDGTPVEGLSLRELWMAGWIAINGEASWLANPWLWCLSFRRVQP